MNNATNVPAPLTVGVSRDFPAGRGYTITVTRDAEHAYRVIVLDMRGRAVDCYGTTFTPERIPADVSVRRAAWTYIEQLKRDFDAELETPKAVAKRVRAARTTVAA